MFVCYVTNLHALSLMFLGYVTKLRAVYFMFVSQIIYEINHIRPAGDK